MHSLELAKHSLAAITIQSVFRSWTCQQERRVNREQLALAQVVTAAVKIQAIVRSWSCQKKLHLQWKHAAAATSIQSLARSFACQREFRQALVLMRSLEVGKQTSAAIVVQSLLFVFL